VPFFLCLLSSARLIIQLPATITSCHLPSSTWILHIQEIPMPPQTSRQTDTTVSLMSSTSSSSKEDAPIIVSSGLPPIPAKLVKRIQERLFVEMSDLLPNTLTLAEYNASEDQTDSRKSKHRRDLSIIEWVQSFTVYLAVISHSKPHCIADLLGYQQRIIQSSCNHQLGCWANYNRHVIIS